MPNQTSQHILNTAANLLGFCLFVITSLHISNKQETTLINRVTAVIAIILTFSCLFSFFSIRTKSPVLTQRLETVADYLFAFSLVSILAVISLIAINII